MGDGELVIDGGEKPDVAAATDVRSVIADAASSAMNAQYHQRLKELDRYFDLSGLLSEQRDRHAIAPYFTQSTPGYLLAHSMRGAMHMALNPEGTFHRRGYEAQSRIVERHIRGLAARRVLEVGCGRGFNLRCLAGRNPGVTLAGIDLTPCHVRAARLAAWRRRNVDVRRGDFHRLPYPDGSFDLVFSVEAICHAADVYEVGEEVHRVLRPGGRFVTIEPWRRPEFDTFEDALKNAWRLVETAFVLPNLQEFDRWLTRTVALGFDPVASEDVTAAALPNLRKLRRQTLRWRHLSWQRPAMHRVAPHLMGNALATMLMGECLHESLPVAPACYRITVVDRRQELA